MRMTLAWIGAWVAYATTALGQGITVEVQFDQQYFLPHETLMAKVRITNFSGQTLKFGTDGNWVAFTVQGQNGFIVPQLRDLPVEGEFELASAQVATRLVNIAPCYDLSRPGHYKITATVRLPNGRGVIESPQASFDLISGGKIWEQDFGLPQVGGGDATEEPEIRKYALVQTIHQSKLRLYLRLSNQAETRVMRVIPIGQMVSFSRPEPQLDRFSNLHLLYQTGPKDYLYSVVNPDGLVIARETYSITTSRPALQSDTDGRIRVVGGARRATPNDIPPPEAAKHLSDANSSQRN